MLPTAFSIPRQNCAEAAAHAVAAWVIVDVEEKSARNDATTRCSNPAGGRLAHADVRTGPGTNTVIASASGVSSRSSMRCRSRRWRSMARRCRLSARGAQARLGIHRPRFTQRNMQEVENELQYP